MHGNNIKFAVVSTVVVVDVTLLTLGRLVIPNFALPVLAQIPSGSTAASAEPITISDSNVKAEVVFKGIDFSTSMFFFGPDDILVLEKNNGIVRRIVNGAMLPEPLLDVSVANKNERGMLGIAVSKNENRTDVFCTILNLEDKMVMMIVLRQPYATREIIRLAIVYTDMI